MCQEAILNSDMMFLIGDKVLDKISFADIARRIMNDYIEFFKKHELLSNIFTLKEEFFKME